MVKKTDPRAAGRAGTDEIELGISACLPGHHVRRCRVEHLALQHYLEPHPRELMSRNHV